FEQQPEKGADTFTVPTLEKQRARSLMSSREAIVIEQITQQHSLDQVEQQQPQPERRASRTLSKGVDTVQITEQKSLESELKKHYADESAKAKEIVTPLSALKIQQSQIIEADKSLQTLKPAQKQAIKKLDKQDSLEIEKIEALEKETDLKTKLPTQESA